MAPWAWATEGGMARISHGRSWIFRQADGIPPGMTVDREGHPWGADEQGGLVRGPRAIAVWAWEPTMQTTRFVLE